MRTRPVERPAKTGINLDRAVATARGVQACNRRVLPDVTEAARDERERWRARLGVRVSRPRYVRAHGVTVELKIKAMVCTGFQLLPLSSLVVASVL